MSQVPNPLEDLGDSDYLEAQSIKWNVARIVRLTSGRFALFSHYHEGALVLRAMGTIEEIAPHIPTAEQCAEPVRARPQPSANSLADLLALVGLNGGES